MILNALKILNYQYNIKNLNLVDFFYFKDSYYSNSWRQYSLWKEVVVADVSKNLLWVPPPAARLTWYHLASKLVCFGVGGMSSFQGVTTYARVQIDQNWCLFCNRLALHATLNSIKENLSTETHGKKMHT